MIGVMVTSTDYSDKPWQQVRESSNEQSTNWNVYWKPQPELSLQYDTEGSACSVVPVENFRWDLHWRAGRAIVCTTERCRTVVPIIISYLTGMWFSVHAWTPPSFSRSNVCSLHSQTYFLKVPF
jgi:hypothetical protein